MWSRVVFSFFLMLFRYSGILWASIHFSDGTFKIPLCCYDGKISNSIFFFFHMIGWSLTQDILIINKIKTLTSSLGFYENVNTFVSTNNLRDMCSKIYSLSCIILNAWSALMKQSYKGYSSYNIPTFFLNISRELISWDYDFNLKSSSRKCRLV